MKLHIIKLALILLIVGGFTWLLALLITARITGILVEVKAIAYPIILILGSGNFLPIIIELEKRKQFIEEAYARSKD